MKLKLRKLWFNFTMIYYSIKFKIKYREIRPNLSQNRFTGEYKGVFTVEATYTVRKK